MLSVMIFLTKVLRHQAKAVSDLVVSVYEDGIVEAAAEVGESPDGLSGKIHSLVVGKRDHPRKLGIFGAQLFCVRAGNDGALGVDHADLPIRGSFHLLDHVGKDMIRHNTELLSV